MSKQRKALDLCLTQGLREDLLLVIWNSYDLGTIRAAVQQLPNIPDPYKDKFRSALKQMSG